MKDCPRHFLILAPVQELKPRRDTPLQQYFTFHLYFSLVKSQLPHSLFRVPTCVEYCIKLYIFVTRTSIDQSIYIQNTKAEV